MRCLPLLTLSILLFSGCTITTPWSTWHDESTITITPTAGYWVTPFAVGLTVPWDMVFTAPNRALITERGGTIRLWQDGKLFPVPLHTFTNIVAKGEAGLLDIELHPQYATNQFVYVSLVIPGDTGPLLRIERFVDHGTTLEFDRTIMENIPTGEYHAGSRLLFDANGLLYVTTGDGATKSRAQDDASLAGKVLRMTDTGAVPQGQTGYVIAKGLRNPQGLALLPDGQMFLTDHGPSVFDGPPGGDELNIGGIGDNFGWPIISHERTQEGVVTPIQVFTPAIAPASALLYTGTMFPEWHGNVLVGLLKGEGIMRVTLNQKEPSSFLQSTPIDEIHYGRIRSIIQGPDGSIYFMTSNTDGRGYAREEDDKIYRMWKE